MAAFIGLDRLKRSIINLADWRGRVRAQTTAHILPLLALLEKGVQPDALTRFEEADDFAFFDRYAKVPGDPENPYFDPFLRQFRIKTHPHSNTATARKGTFARTWNAAEFTEQNDETFWSLSPNYVQIVQDRVLTKGTNTVRLPVVDLAVWLFREEEFPDGATTDTLVERFRERFRLDVETFNSLFVYEQEPAAGVFVGTKPSQEEVTALIRSLELKRAEQAVQTAAVAPASSPEEIQIGQDDPVLGEVNALAALGTSGVILRGPPGTGKSWYAEQIALSLTQGVRERIYRVQFHPTYSYEDFFDGYVPAEDTRSGFKIEGKVFRKAIDHAASTADVVVLVIDEINRGDTARIFGESLTYIEQGWRGVPFAPRFGGPTRVPKNLFVIGTMNPHDRSITQLDMALLRRFDHIDIEPSPELAREFLESAGMAHNRAELVVEWFLTLQRLMPFGLGHTFFRGVSDEGKLGLMWRYRILPFCRAILEFEPERLQDVTASFEALRARLREVGAAG